MLVDHLPNRHRELRDELKRVEQREQDIRAELSRLEKHAAIEGITVGAITAEPADPFLNSHAPKLPAPTPTEATP